MSFLNSISTLDFLFTITPEVPQKKTVLARTIAEKIDNNLAALRLVKECLTDNRTLLNEQERATLEQYAGWGQLSGLFEPEHPRHDELKALLMPAEFQAVQSSILTSYYTADWLVDSMYRAVSRLGVHEGHMLDPATGTGRFLSRLPATMSAIRPVGIELEGLTGNIARLLNPSSKIYVNQPFEAVKLPNTGDYSLVIGNPPYSSVKARDKRFGPLSLHNYFMLRGLTELHHGGLMAYVVSSWVMDSKDPALRQELAFQGQLIAACRLPNSVFAGEGANVVSDILIFQACEYPDENPAWLETVELPNGQGGGYSVNRLFVEHPELVAGTIGEPGTFNLSCSVTGPEGQALADLVNQILDGQTKAPVFYRRDNQLPARRGSIVAPADMGDVGQYEYCLSPDGQLFRRVGDSLDEDGHSQAAYESIEPSREKDRLRILGMLQVKAALAALLQAETEDTDSRTIQSHRANLNATYDAYVVDFGPFHSSKNKQVLSADPWYYRLRALEVDYCAPISKTVAEKEGVEPRPERWEKGTLFTRRVIKPVVPPSMAADLREAVLISASYLGRVDLAYVARLVSFSGSQHALMDDLAGQGLAFLDPETNEVITGAKYLSGFVRRKLDLAKEAAEQDPRFINNVLHLEAVQPAPVPALDVFVPLNAGWLPTRVYEAFIRFLVDDATLAVKVIYLLGNFNLKFESAISKIKETIEWGTARRPMSMLLDALMNNRAIKVEDKDPVLDRYFVNEEETLAAQHKAEAIRAAWDAWVMDDAERREIIEESYNAHFNGFVAPKYDGSMLPLDGCSLDLYPTQRNGIARGLFERTMLIDHAVGAGKTNLMIGLAHELRHINPHERIILVAPNHLVSQHATAAQSLFPGMNVFVLDKKMMEPATRRAALARLMVSDFDLCIIPLSVFGLIPAPHDLLVAMMQEEIDALSDALMTMKSEHLPIREMVKRIENKQIQLDELIDKQTDEFLDFASLRISTLIVDESQFAKNLAYTSTLSNVAGMGSPEGSKRAFDLYVKSRFVLKAGGRYIEATGTPLLNSIVEAHRHLRFFAEDYTKQAGLHHFDAFSSVFAQPVTDYELAASGRGYKQRTRISQFTNLPELQAVYSSFADVVTLEQLPIVLPRLPDGRSAIPPLRGGKVQELVIEPNAHQEEGFREVVARFNSVDRRDNNPLKLMHMGRQLSMDARLVYADAPDYEDSKINVIVNYMIDKYRATTAVKGTQIVFMDRSIPARHRANANKEWLNKLARAKAGDDEAIAELEGIDPDTIDTIMQSTFSLYDELVEKLVLAGIPRHEIAVIHDYRTDARKEMLREKMNRGEIRVLIGSTELMGSGLNVNRRLVALIDFDLPLRPGDLQQRHGRIERQGNELWLADPSFNIDIVIPITRRTLDAWQLGLLNAKQTFITRFRQLENSVRHYTEQQEVIDFAELSAIVADDPRILEHVRGKAALKKLEAAKNNWFRNRARMQDSQLHLTNRIALIAKQLPLAEQDARTVMQTSPDFAMEVNGIIYDKKGVAVTSENGAAPEDAANALRVAFHSIKSKQRGHFELATYRGMTLTLRRSNLFSLNDYDGGFSVQGQGRYDLTHAIKTQTVNGLLSAFVRFVDETNKFPEQLQQAKERAELKMAALQVEIDKPFTQQEELNALIARLKELERALLDSKGAANDKANDSDNHTVIAA